MKLGDQRNPNQSEPLIDGLYTVEELNTDPGENLIINVGRSEVSRGEVYVEGGRKLQLVTYDDDTTEIIDLGAAEVEEPGDEESEEETETPELDYIKMQEDYFNALEDYNLNPQFFADKITDLFANDVDPKTFTGRLKTAYDSLFNQFDAVKAYYVENYPGQFPSVDNITDEAIFASFISEDISKDIIAQRINVSEIGGAFRDEDFTISTQQAQRLISAGLSGTGAQQIAQRAESQLPRLQKLAKRFTGREDIFGLSEFIESEVFGGGVAEQVRQRLEAEQRTVFTQEGGAAATQAGITGLVEQ